MATTRQRTIHAISAELRAKAAQFLLERKKVNILVEVVTSFENQNESYIPSILAVEMIFTDLLKQGDMFKTVEPLKPQGTTKADTHRETLRSMYEVTFKQLVKCLGQGVPQSRVQALATCMALIKEHTLNPIDNTDREQTGHYFPLHMLQAVIGELLNSENNLSTITRYKEYASYKDILYYSWKVLSRLAVRKTASDTYARNYLEIADKLVLKKDNKKTKHVPEEDRKLLCELQGKQTFYFNYSKVQRWILKCWGTITTWNLSADNHRRALLVLLERMLPHMPNPTLLTDFFMDSLDKGGAVSMLSLQGVFTLIQQYNLEYPQVYTKLYAMFEPEMYHIRHKSRLFYLADMFLSSTHLPEALVAGFVKRMCRLALMAPAGDTMVLMRMVHNLMIRHPGLKRMSASPEDINNVRHVSSSDPYIMDERDPAASNALNSCVWEAQALRNHVMPLVALEAHKVLDVCNARMETPIAQLINDDYDDMFDKEIKKPYKQVFLTFSRPTSLAIPGPNDKLTKLWQLT